MLKFLGFLATSEGIKPILEKTGAILALPPPAEAREAASFNGMVGQYQNFISAFAIKTAALGFCKRKTTVYLGTCSKPRLRKPPQQLSSSPYHQTTKFLELHTDAAGKNGIAVISCSKSHANTLKALLIKALLIL